MDDFYVFFKNDRNYFLRQFHFILSLIGFIFLISTNKIDSIIVALAVPGNVLICAILLGLYWLDDRHESTDIEILMSYGILNILASMIFVNKTLNMDTSVFSMIFLNPYTINITICLCLGLLMLGEAVYRLIVIVVRNIYNMQNISKSNIIYPGKDANSSLNFSKIHNQRIPHEDDTNTSSNTSGNETLSPTTTYAEKDTSTYENIQTNTPYNEKPTPVFPTMVDNHTGCTHYLLKNEIDRRSGDGINRHIDNDNYIKIDSNMSHMNGEPINNFYPKQYVRPVTKSPVDMNSQTSTCFNEAGLPVFIDRYGKRYIASLAGNTFSNRFSLKNNYDTRVKNDYDMDKISTPIDEYYTNRKYCNSKVTLTPSRDEANYSTNTETKRAPTKGNANHDKNPHNRNNHTNNTCAANCSYDLAYTKDKDSNNNDLIANYKNEIANLCNNNNNNNSNNNSRKRFNYKFYNHNYDYQWVCEA